MIKANPKNKVFIFFGLMALLCLGVDMWSKQWAIAHTDSVQNLIGNWLSLVPFQKNEGIAFSITLPSWIQTGGSLVILMALTYMGLGHILKEGRKPYLQSFFLAIAVGGGLGNLVDRFTQGYVVDFIRIPNWPIFNLADIGITVGLLGLFATMQLATKNEIT